jgi:hypothetical protein
MPHCPDSVLRILALAVLGCGEAAIYMPGTIVL